MRMQKAGEANSARGLFAMVPISCPSCVLRLELHGVDVPGRGGGSEKPGKLEVGGASRDSTGLGALEEGLISS